MFINFSDLPKHHNIFLDYLYEFENVKDFYTKNFRNKDEYIQHFKKISEQENLFQNEVAQIVSEEYLNYSPSIKTQKNLNKLSAKNCCVIFTGQQVGLLGGPLYTFLKIITTIKLASFLNERFDDFYFVPMFWLEGDDHDFQEVSYVNLLDESNAIKKIIYNDGLPEVENRGSIGNVKFNINLNNFLNEFEQSLRQSDFKESITSFVRKIYTEGSTFKSSFKELLFNLFDKYGLVLFDPQQPSVKKLLKPIFKNEIINFRSHSEKLISVAAELEEQYHAQVKVRPINLFMNSDDSRHSIEPIDNGFRLKGKRVKFTQEELLNIIETNPELFSPNVLLRPICQDYLFKTAFYVAGPSEISYFAQLMPLYNFYGIESPIIYPRSSVTILEKGIDSLLERFDLTLSEIFVNRDNLSDLVLKKVSSIQIEEIFANTQNKIDDSMNELKFALAEIDKTTSEMTDKYSNKIKSYIVELKAKSIEAEKRKHEIVLRQLLKIENSIIPNSNLQERELNFFYFANKYGINFIDVLFDEVLINKFEHQIIKI
ncbi:MAG: bacillithiol biosynthesis cysteine-adding enzyme BshC [Chlorobiaceae bacterium]|nr:bacillithiol biosynthesis cysteine-adding enzyme BshC [Chlorobiaceae bacterium]MBA4308924.1 bacillithiol biosynthesis cysteine-adding enzyme BshC [Chlorobiaceae bacterium]